MLGRTSNDAALPRNGLPFRNTTAKSALRKRCFGESPAPLRCKFRYYNLHAKAHTALRATGTNHGASTTGSHSFEKSMGALSLDNGGLIGAFHDVGRPDYIGNPLLDVALPYVVNEGRPVKLWISPAKMGKIRVL